MQGFRTEMCIRDRRNVLYLKGDGTTVTAMDTVNGNMDQIPITAYE